MAPKVKVRKLTVTAFRGARKQIWLDFGPRSRSLVLFGSNGDGKSTFSDAIEWFFTDKIQYLQRDGCGREDYFNRYITPAQDGAVEIKFSDSALDSQKTLHTKGGRSFGNTSPGFRSYLGDSARDSLILRHHTMREFIERTKKEKLQTLEEIIGFRVIAETRGTLLKAVNALRDDSQLATLQGQRGERKRDLASVIGEREFEDADVVKHAHDLARQCDPSLSIANDSQFQTAVQTLDKVSKAGERGRELSALADAAQKVARLHDVAAAVRGVCGLVAQHNKLAKDEETVRAAALQKLYRAAIEAMEAELVEPGKCPICSAPVETDELLRSLSDEVAKIGALLTERDQTVQDGKALTTTVASLRETLHSLLQHDVAEVIFRDEETSAIESILGTLSACTKALDQIQVSYEPLDVPSDPQELGAILTTEAALQARISQRTTELEGTDQERTFYRRVNALRKLLEDYLRYKQLTGRAAVYEAQVESLQKAYQQFETMERRSVAQVLTAISSDVNDFMTFLHPDDDFDAVELIVTGPRGIEFRLKYHGQEVSPPMKMLSEAHLNSLGICAFIASAKHFNRTNGFLILDDVVTSFDAGHRRTLSRLLSEKLADTQILLFTHDDLWFDMLKKDLPAGQWLFKELTKWTKQDGVDLRDSPLTLKERIDSYLATNDVPGAANKCRILIEESLKETSERLGVRGLEFKRGRANDERSAAELIDALTSYLKRNQSLRDKASKRSFEYLRATQLVTNIGSHHRTLEATGLARGDIETAVRDIELFESLFVCPDCNTQPSKKFSPPRSDKKQCRCAELWI